MKNSVMRMDVERRRMNGRPMHRRMDSVNMDLREKGSPVFFRYCEHSNLSIIHLKGYFYSCPSLRLVGESTTSYTFTP